MPNSHPELFLGLISGTSADGIDVALVDFAGGACRLVLGRTYPWDAVVRERLVVLGQGGDATSLDELGGLDVQVAQAFAEAARRLIGEAGIDAAQVRALGSHGQTVRHRPQQALPFTWQLGDGNVIAERSGITTIADFRRRDIAAGGQGAPLVPAFHAALFGDARAHRVVVNLGGIANVTDLPPAGSVRGFDTGPGNVLSDLWHAQHRSGPFDADGAWAACGRPIPALLDAMLGDPYFSEAPPKSTGRDRFHSSWLDEHLARSAPTAAPPDVQATLVALTARTIADAVRTHAGRATEVLVCGGGARNATLMRALAHELAGCAVAPTSERGVAVDHVEALAFAWLAREALAGRPGNLADVTGARGPRVLGAVYPK